MFFPPKGFDTDISMVPAMSSCATLRLNAERTQDGALSSPARSGRARKHESMTTCPEAHDARKDGFVERGPEVERREVDAACTVSSPHHAEFGKKSASREASGARYRDGTAATGLEIDNRGATNCVDKGESSSTTISWRNTLRPYCIDPTEEASPVQARESRNQNLQANDGTLSQRSSSCVRPSPLLLGVAYCSRISPLLVVPLNRLSLTCNTTDFRSRRKSDRSYDTRPVKSRESRLSRAGSWEFAGSYTMGE